MSFDVFDVSDASATVLKEGAGEVGLSLPAPISWELEELSDRECRFLSVLPFSLETDWLIPFGFSAESVRSLIGCHGSDR